MESTTYLKNLDITPKKLRMLLPKVKKMTPLAATGALFYSPRKAGQVFYKAIKSAMSNAKQTLKVTDDLLQFKLFTVEEGNKLKRYTAGSRGNAKPVRKRYAHIKIVLTAKPMDEAKKATPSVKLQEANVSQEVQETVSVPKTAKKTAVKKIATKKAVKKTEVT